jgi:hypothetical protein
MTPLKTLKAQRAGLCYDRNVWQGNVPDVLPIDYLLDCGKHAKSDPHCEGCCSKFHRADRLDEIATGIKAIDVEITELTGKPYATAKPKLAKPAQLALF